MRRGPASPAIRTLRTTGTRLLEGGCGRGQYVVYYSRKGVRVTGIDFAAGALVRLRGRNPEAHLCLGDVAALPFRDGSYDAYYSGGVVEHFEGGPVPALREAGRVLRPGGTLLVSVPYLSPLRRISAAWRNDRRHVTKARANAELDEKTFWQYAFGVREFSQLLQQVGFRVDRTFPYAILFGLYDLPLVPRLLSRASKGPSTPAEKSPDVGGSRQPTTPSLLKRLVVSEDRRVPVLGAFVEVCRTVLREHDDVRLHSLRGGCPSLASSST